MSNPIWVQIRGFASVLGSLDGSSVSLTHKTLAAPAERENYIVDKEKLPRRYNYIDIMLTITGTNLWGSSSVMVLGMNPAVKQRSTNLLRVW